MDTALLLTARWYIRILVLHAARVAADDITHHIVPGVGVARSTSLARTVVECAMKAPFEQAVVIGDSALHAGLDRRAVEALMASFAGRKGIRHARLVVDSLNGLSESAGETRTRLMVGELPVEPPELQVRINTSTGNYRVDFVWQNIRLILEFDGDSKYFDCAKSADQALIDERERENALIEEGWRFIRVKWRHLQNPEILKVRIMIAYLAAARAAA